MARARVPARLALALPGSWGGGGDSNFSKACLPCPLAHALRLTHRAANPLVAATTATLDAERRRTPRPQAPPPALLAVAAHTFRTFHAWQGKVNTYSGYIGASWGLYELGLRPVATALTGAVEKIDWGGPT